MQHIEIKKKVSDELLETLIVMKEKYPELRLGQLISNTMDKYNERKVDLFYVEDSLLTDWLRRYDENQFHIRFIQSKINQ